MKKIIFHAYDAGGGNAIFPVAKAISGSPDFEYLCLVGGPSRDIFERENIKFIDADTLSDNEILNTIKDFNPEVMVGGRSAGQTFEKRLFPQIKQFGIKTVCVLDFWAHYWESFSNKDKDFAYLTDFIFVMDELAKNEMIAEGFDAGRIIVTGNPYFDDFLKGIKVESEDKNKILFVSQPHDDQFEVLEDLIKSTQNVSSDYILTIRPHPKEDSEKFNRYLSDRVLLNRDKKIEDLIGESGLIVGMNSMVLFQASVASKKVISYQPNLKTKDYLISNKLGLSHFATNKIEFDSLIRDYFENRLVLPKGSSQGIIIQNATNNVVELVKKI